MKKAITIAAGKNEACVKEATEIEKGKGYKVAAIATNGAEYTITKTGEGVVTRGCNAEAEKTKGGCIAGTWSS